MALSKKHKRSRSVLAYQKLSCNFTAAAYLLHLPHYEHQRCSALCPCSPKISLFQDKARHRIYLQT